MYPTRAQAKTAVDGVEIIVLDTLLGQPFVAARRKLIDYFLAEARAELRKKSSPHRAMYAARRAIRALEADDEELAREARTWKVDITAEVAQDFRARFPYTCDECGKPDGFRGTCLDCRMAKLPWKVGDVVRINAPGLPSHGKTGEVAYRYTNGYTLVDTGDPITGGILSNDGTWKNDRLELVESRSTA